MRNNKSTRTIDQPETPESSQMAPPPLGIITHVVYPGAVYTVDDLRRIFGLKASSVRREVRLRRLRISKRCGRYYCLGQWVLAWLEDGELKPRMPIEASTTDSRSERGLRSHGNVQEYRQLGS